MAAGPEPLMQEEKAQSFFKHRFLDRYIKEFSFKLTGSSANRIVIVDGFAGPGVYEDGTPGSAHMMVQLGRVRPEFHVRLIEKKPGYVTSLNRLVQQAADEDGGTRAQVLPGDAARHLPAVMAGSVDAHVFLYLDPCGYGLSFDQLVELFAGRPDWPRTEMMLNFSADLVRRLGGANFKGTDEALKLTAACGGDWWIDLAQPVVENDGNWANALSLVMDELARRLAQALGRHVFAAPIRADLGQEPRFHMVCATSSGHGLLSLSHCFAFAWDDWANELARRDVQEDLFGNVVGAAALRSGRNIAQAKQWVKEDVRTLPPGSHRVGDAAPKILQRAMGQLKEGELRAALKEMNGKGIAFTNNKQLGQATIQLT